MQALSQQKECIDEIICVCNSEYFEKPLYNFNLPITYLHEPIRSSYRARNRGIEYSHGDILIFIDSDCIPQENYLRNIHTFCSSQGIFAGNVEIIYKNTRGNIYEVYDKFVYLDQEEYSKRGFGATANLIISRDILENVGYFNAELLSSGDLEWCHRATALGYSIQYLPQIHVRHPARNSYKELIKKAIRIRKGHNSIQHVSHSNYKTLYSKIIYKKKKFSLSWLNIFLSLLLHKIIKYHLIILSYKNIGKSVINIPLLMRRMAQVASKI